MSAVWNERGQVFPPRRVGKKLLFPTRNHRKRTARNTCKTDALQSPSLSLSLAVIKRTRNYPKYIQQTIVCTRALRWIDTGEPRPITRYREEMKSSLKLVRPVSWTRPLNGQKPPRYFSPIFSSAFPAARNFLPDNRPPRFLSSIDMNPRIRPTMREGNDDRIHTNTLSKGRMMAWLQQPWTRREREMRKSVRIVSFFWLPVGGDGSSGVTGAVIFLLFLAKNKKKQVRRQATTLIKQAKRIQIDIQVQVQDGIFSFRYARRRVRNVYLLEQVLGASS